MNPPDLLKELLAAGFRFALTADGGMSFTRPEREDAEAERLCSILAWRLGELEDAVREHMTAQPKETR